MRLVRTFLSFSDNIYNRFSFWIRKVEYTEFPRIYGRLIIGGRGGLRFGDEVIINSSHRSNPVGLSVFSSFHIAPGASIQIGDRAGISNTLIYARRSIKIGQDVRIGGGCQILDNDFHDVIYEGRIHGGDENVATAPIILEEGVFIGTSCIILKGVTVGARSVVAAGSVVTKNIPADEIWGGNPCRFLKKLKAS